MTKEEIKQLIKDKPKHFSRIIKARHKDLYNEVNRGPGKNFSENLYLYLNNITNKCERGNTKKFDSINNGYKFCGNAKKCLCCKESMSKKLKKSLKDVDFEEVIRKRRETNLKKYGHINAGQSTKAKEAHKKHYSKKYTTEYFIERANKVHGEGKYDYSKVVYSNQVTNVEIICSEHGSFMQTPGSHLGGSGCLKCAGNEKLSTEEYIRILPKEHLEKYKYDKTEYIGSLDNITVGCPTHGYFEISASRHKLGAGCAKCANEDSILGNEKFILKAIQKHGDVYSYDKINYEGTRIPIEIVCKEHGSFWQRPNDHLNGCACPTCGRKKQFGNTGPSTFEREVLDYIKEIYSGKIETSDWSILKNRELDIFLPELNLAIECNGAYWHSENRGKGKEYHLDKTERCEEKGIRLIHIWSHEWLLKRRKIEYLLQSVLNLNKIIYARKCEVREINKKEAKTFIDKYHMQNNSGQSIALGLYHDDELVSCMTFGKSRYNKNVEYELIRFVSKGGTTIVGGGSKLLKHFEKTYKPKSLISYCHRHLFTGKLYEKLGFKFSHCSSPSYKYTMDYLEFFSREAFQKSKLENRLVEYDPELTADLNIKMNGWDRIWDCGNLVYLKNYA